MFHKRCARCNLYHTCYFYNTCTILFFTNKTNIHIKISENILQYREFKDNVDIVSSIDIVGNADIVGNVDIVGNADIVGNVDIVENVDIVDIVDIDY